LKYGADVNASDENGNTPLFLASKYEHLEIVKELIKNSADVNIQNKDGHTPLLFASLKGNLEIVKELLNNDADITIKDNDGITALSYAGYSAIDKVSARRNIMKEYDDRNLLSCDYCNNKSDLNLELCSKCMSCLYCNQECQRNHWSEHKKVCKKYDRI
jgi:hypothetical protein